MRHTASRSGGAFGTGAGMGGPWAGSAASLAGHETLAPTCPPAAVRRDLAQCEWMGREYTGRKQRQFENVKSGVSDWRNWGNVHRNINSIVCTLEELKELWAMAKSGPDYPGVLELFLKSKGIVT